MAAAIPAPIPNDGVCINRVNEIQSHLVVCVIGKIQNSKTHLTDILLTSGLGKSFPLCSSVHICQNNYSNSRAEKNKKYSQV